MLWRPLLTMVPKRQLSTTVARRYGHGVDPPGGVSQIFFKISTFDHAAMFSCYLMRSIHNLGLW